jgi:hypothetical protein
MKDKADFIIKIKSDLTTEEQDKIVKRISDFDNVLLIFDTDNDVEVIENTNNNRTIMSVLRLIKQSFINYVRR